jgi:hypothetical protein
LAYPWHSTLDYLLPFKPTNCTGLVMAGKRILVLDS